MEECGQLLKCFVSCPEDTTNKLYHRSGFVCECLPETNSLDVSVVGADVAVAVLVVDAQLFVTCRQLKGRAVKMRHTRDSPQVPIRISFKSFIKKENN